MNLIQLRNASGRRVAIVQGSRAELLRDVESAYALAHRAITVSGRLTNVAAALTSGESVDYDAIYRGESEWRLLPSFDHPSDAAHCTVSGTGLTHKASAENRAAMHRQQGYHQAGEQITDSMRMYEMGLAGGNPAAGEIGAQPEWFYKGNGSILRAHGEELRVPPYAEDGGEEPEIAGAYVIGPGGWPFRVGLSVGNEFSDHRMEKRNYLYLAHSKLRTCAIGPELIVGDAPFDNVQGAVTIRRGGVELWRKQIFSGAANMCHSVSNLEHHHFKHQPHRIPGDVHVHFFGADAFSFGDGMQLADGDTAEIEFEGFGRALRNTICVDRARQELVIAQPL